MTEFALILGTDHTGGSVISKHPQRFGKNSGRLAMFWANPRARRCTTCRSNPRSKENTKFARAQALRPSPRPGAFGRLAAPNRGRHCANVRVSQDVSDQHGPHAGSPRRVTARPHLTSCATPVRQRLLAFGPPGIDPPARGRTTYVLVKPRRLTLLTGVCDAVFLGKH